MASVDPIVLTRFCRLCRRRASEAAWRARAAEGHPHVFGSRDLQLTSVALQSLQSDLRPGPPFQSSNHRMSVFDSSSSKLLIVQAEPVLAELTSFRLELLGYQIELVGTGGEAIASIHTSLPDLVIVDTQLPDVDGIEWIARIRDEFNAEQLPVIVFSLDPSLETVERAFHAGTQDYLITPFDPTVMEEKIESLLSTHAAPRR